MCLIMDSGLISSTVHLLMFDHLRGSSLIFLVFKFHMFALCLLMNIAFFFVHLNFVCSSSTFFRSPLQNNFNYADIDFNEKL